MSPSLARLFGQNSTRNVDLRRLMLQCHHGAQTIYAVCVGAGDAFINRYWPVLRMAVARKRLHLLVADEHPLEALRSGKTQQAEQSGEQEAAKNLARGYEELMSDVKGKGDVIYVNRTDPKERHWYGHVRADIVFVLVPDDQHIKVAKDWLRRSTLIIIEKPYNRLLREAEQFQRDLGLMMNHIGGDVPATWVCAFDHYLAKIGRYAFAKEKDSLFSRIGALERVEFAILEKGPVEAWRGRSLEAGMIYDLFSHVLAMLSLELDLSTFHEDAVTEIKVAHHKDCPCGFQADTFAHLDFALKNYDGREIKVVGDVGKGVGDRDDKFLTLVGEFGLIQCDLNPRGSGKILIEERDHRTRQPIPGTRQPIYDVGRGHEEFLETLLAGRYVEEPTGGMTGDTAIEILRIMNSIRETIPDSMYTYDVGDPKNDIAESATPLPIARSD